MTEITISTTSPELYKRQSRHSGYKLQKSLNPHLVLHYDIVRNTKTLHYEIKTYHHPSLASHLVNAMRGYNGMMRSNDCSCDVSGNGQRVHIQQKHCLWQPPTSSADKGEPIWHLRITVLKDKEARADVPGRRFAFTSMHHLTHAANQLEAAFGETFNMNKNGLETPGAMGDRVSDGRSANVTIEYQSDTAKAGWSDFLAKLKVLEDEWDHEGAEVKEVEVDV